MEMSKEFKNKLIERLEEVKPLDIEKMVRENVVFNCASSDLDFEINYYSSYLVRDVVTEYTWVMPTKRNGQLISENILGNVLDIGCGSGFWSRMLEKKLNIKPFGIRLSKYKTDNNSVYDNIKEVSFYDMSDEELAKYETWLLFWPPYDSELATDVLKKFMEIPEAKRIIHIGEIYGCTAADSFFELKGELETQNKIKITSYEIDQFDGIHDILEVIEKL